MTTYHRLGTLGFRMNDPTYHTKVNRQGFSLIELLVVIAIIAVLIALLFPALGICQRLARQSREAAAGSQLMLAYSTYSNENRGYVLPGYTSNSMVSGTGPGTISVTDETGQRLSGQVARRYPWRIAPTMDYNFRALYDDGRLLERYTNQTDRQYIVSVSPTFGLNADFVGGKGDPGFAFNANASRLWGQFYVTKLDQIRRSDRLLVFASARGVDATAAAINGDGNGTVPGFHIVNSPYLQASRWESGAYNPELEPEQFGYIHPRHAGKLNVAHADGHVALLAFDDLRDMTRWSNQATRADWTLGSN